MIYQVPAAILVPASFVAVCAESFSLLKLMASMRGLQRRTSGSSTEHFTL